jgi:hypothetical protein
VKLILNEERIIQFEPGLPRLMKKFNHYGNFHCARGMEGFFIMKRVPDVTIEAAEGNGDIRSALVDSFFDVRA